MAYMYSEVLKNPQLAVDFSVNFSAILLAFKMEVPDSVDFC